MLYRLVIVLFVAFSSTIFAQHPHHQNHSYNLQDSLRGSITPERAWWDLQHYELSVMINPENKSISGENIISYKVLERSDVLQIDLQEPLAIDKIVQDGVNLKFEAIGPAHFIQLQKVQTKGSIEKLKIEYSGKPLVARRAPWDGGFSWEADKNGQHFVATSCQGLGASVWWPCKDHMYDEPDQGMIIHATVPDKLVAVANGRLQDSKHNKKVKTKTFTWKVIHPINNYGVNINMGDYVHFSEIYEGEKGALDMDYWVLSYNLEKAKVHFKQASQTIEALEHWFGPYPFYEDSYKLVEVPYLGMEHQSSVTYGNGYKNGFNGNDHTGAGWGGKFDYIIIHETAHEWFANNITYKDIADLWIHESFACYAEALFVEYFHGKQAASEYILSSRMSIRNRIPIIGDYDVNAMPRGDTYNKGSNMLHTLRQVVNDDEKWRALLRGLNNHFYHQTVTSKEIETFISQSLNLDLELFFDQYLRDTRIPVFEYQIIGNQLIFRWTNCIRGFNMPIRIHVNGQEHAAKLSGNRRFSTLNFDTEILEISFDPNYYIYHSNTMKE